MIKKPCYFTVVKHKDNKERISAVCVECKKSKNLQGWYWNSDFHPEEEKIVCHYCPSVIYLKEDQ